MRAAAYILAGYAVMVGLAYLFQKRMTYFPERFSTGDLQRQAKAAGLQLWPDEGPEYMALIADRYPEATKGTVIVFHGNAGAAVHRFYYMQALQRLGYRVVVAEYPGYGARSGNPGEQAFIDAGKGLVRVVNDRFGPPIFLWGESLGCGVASALVVEATVPVKGVVLVTPWNSLPDLAQKLYWYLPVRWLGKERYDNAANLAEYTGPVAVVMAGSDEIIPPRITQALYKALPEPKRHWLFAGAGHNTWPAGPGEAWWGEVMEFVAGN